MNMYSNKKAQLYEKHFALHFIPKTKTYNLLIKDANDLFKDLVVKEFL